MMKIIPPSPQQDAVRDSSGAAVPEEGDLTDEQKFRNFFVRVAASKAGLNFRDDPDKFLDLLMSPGDVKYYNKAIRSYFSTPLNPQEPEWIQTARKIGALAGVPTKAKRGVSTCGLVVRGILREAGIDPIKAPEFYGPYVDPTGKYTHDGKPRPPGRAVQDIIDLGMNNGAWTEADQLDAPLPKAGDIVVSGGRVETPARQAGRGAEHVYTLAGDVKATDNPKQTEAFDGIDGGNVVYDPSDGSTNKQATKLIPRANGWYVANDWKGRPRWKAYHGKFIQGWISIGVLRDAGFFTGGAIEFGDPTAEDDAQIDVGEDPYGTGEAFEEQPTTEGGVAVAQGNGLLFSLEPTGFLDILYEYLRQRFENDYKKNASREQFAIHGGDDIYRPNDGFEQDNILPDPSNSLFDRASQGDPDALNALKYQANFNFGQSEKALDEFKDQFNEGGKIDQLTDKLEDQVGGMFDASTGEIVDAVTAALGVPSVPTEPPPEEEEPTGEASSPLQQAIEDKQRPGASTTAPIPKLSSSQHQPSTQPMVLPIPLNLEPAP